MRLLSSEAKDWKSRVVTEAEEALCRESAQVAQQATEAQEAMDQHYKAKWRQAEAALRDLCQSNSAQVQSLASKLQETHLEHQQLHTAQERQLQLEAQALRQAQIDEQQATALPVNMNLLFKISKTSRRTTRASQTPMATTTFSAVLIQGRDP